MEFVRASLLKNDTIFIERTTTDNLGGFSFKAEKGNYALILEQFGKKIFHRQLEFDQNKDIGEIEIDESVILKEVAITSQKKLIERKADRLVFNIERSVASAGMDATEALSVTPLLNVSDNGISIIGRSGAEVMIDERIINLSGNALMNYLKTIRSENIKSIEVITTPPAKYEAQGNGGLINIRLKKNPNYGWSGMLSSSYIKRNRSSFLSNALLNYSTEKLQASATIGYNN